MSASPATTSPGQFAAFCREYRAELVGRARRILHSLPDAEDVVQETLTAVWKRSGGMPEAQWLAYTRRAVQLNAIRKRMRRRPVVSLDSAGVEPAAPEHSGFSPADLEQAIAELPLAQQAAIRARFYTGLTFAEVAQQLAISQNTVASRCRYAIETLRRRLGDIKRSERRRP